LNGLGIVAALAAEARPLGAASPPLRTPTELPDGTLLILSGVGMAAATDGARRLAQSGVRALVSWGMAGGLDPALAAGTLVLPMEVMSPEGLLFTTAGEWRERVTAAVTAGHRVSCGRLLTGVEAIGSVAAKSLAFRRTTAVAVDMESAAIAQVAAAARLPFLAVRAIVDSAADEVPRAALAALTPGTGALRVGRVLAALLRAPGEAAALVRLSGGYRSARRALTAVARSGALTPAAARVQLRGALS
jgi:adenosylhomocysteine nucleosidase